MKTSLTGRKIWAAPLVVGLISACGLVAALLLDGIGDAVSWIALAVPVVIGLWCVIRHA
ncbi:MAG: hypothetical protein QX199_12845 [Methylococcaceae bacterium]